MWGGGEGLCCLRLRLTEVAVVAAAAAAAGGGSTAATEEQSEENRCLIVQWEKEARDAKALTLDISIHSNSRGSKQPMATMERN